MSDVSWIILIDCPICGGTGERTPETGKYAGVTRKCGRCTSIHPGKITKRVYRRGFRTPELAKQFAAGMKDKRDDVSGIRISSNAAHGL